VTLAAIWFLRRGRDRLHPKAILLQGTPIVCEPAHTRKSAFELFIPRGPAERTDLRFDLTCRELAFLLLLSCNGGLYNSALSSRGGQAVTGFQRSPSRVPAGLSRKRPYTFHRTACFGQTGMSVGRTSPTWSMIRKSGYRFSEKIMPQTKG